MSSPCKSRTSLCTDRGFLVKASWGWCSDIFGDKSIHFQPANTQVEQSKNKSQRQVYPASLHKQDLLNSPSAPPETPPQKEASASYL